MSSFQWTNCGETLSRNSNRTHMHKRKYGQLQSIKVKENIKR